MDSLRDKREKILFALIIFFAFILNYKILRADFLFDDYPVIVDNPLIKHLNFLELWRYDPSRFLTNFTFTLNYLLSGLDGMGWHVVNTLLHAAVSFGIYRLTFLTLQTPAIKNVFPSQHHFYFSSCVALFFLVHPIQTQAVIYLVQRSTLLSLLLCLASLQSYLLARLTNNRKYYLYALLWGYAGVLAKPLTIVLPLLVALYEICLWDLRKKIEREDVQRIICYALLCLMLLVIPLGLLGIPQLSSLAVQGAETASWPIRLLTELNVMITAVRLLVFPIGQNVDYDYPLANDLLEFPTALSLALLVGLAGLAVGLRRRYPLMSFGIGWFFIALSPVVIFPLPDLFFEHWLYPASYGFILVIAAIFYNIIQDKKILVPWAAGIFILTGVAAYQRTLLWRDPIALMEDVVRKSPQKARAQNNLGWMLFKKGNVRRAQEAFAKAVQLDPRYPVAQNNLASTFLRLNRAAQAKTIWEKLVQEFPPYLDPYLNLASLYQEEGNPQKAMNYFFFVLQKEPYNATAHMGLGNIFEALGDGVRAKVYFQKAIWLKPDNALAYYNLGNIYFNERNFYEALLDYEKAIAIQPDFAEAHINAGNIYFSFGDYRNALDYYQKAVRYNPQLPEGYFNLANALHATGAVEESQKAIEQALPLYEEQGKTEVVRDLKRKLKAMTP